MLYLSLNYIKQNKLKDTSWFSGVFANTVALTPTSCIPLESSDHGGCYYVPFIGTGEAVWESLVLHKSVRKFGNSADSIGLKLDF